MKYGTPSNKLAEDFSVIFANSVSQKPVLMVLIWVNHRREIYFKHAQMFTPELKPQNT